MWIKEGFHIRSYQDLSIQYVGIWSQFEHATPVTSPNMQGRLVTVHWKNVSKSFILCDPTVHQRLEKYQWDISVCLWHVTNLLVVLPGWTLKGFILLGWGGPQAVGSGEFMHVPTCKTVTLVWVEHGHWLEGLHGSRHSCLGLCWGGIWYNTIYLSLMSGNAMTRG